MHEKQNKALKTKQSEVTLLRKGLAWICIMIGMLGFSFSWLRYDDAIERGMNWFVASFFTVIPGAFWYAAWLGLTKRLVRWGAP